MCPLGDGHIHTRSQAGGMASDLIRIKVWASLTRLPVALTYTKPFPRRSRPSPGEPSFTHRNPAAFADSTGSGCNSADFTLRRRIWPIACVIMSGYPLRERHANPESSLQACIHPFHLTRGETWLVFTDIMLAL